MDPLFLTIIFILKKLKPHNPSLSTSPLDHMVCIYDPLLFLPVAPREKKKMYLRKYVHIHPKKSKRKKTCTYANMYTFTGKKSKKKRMDVHILEGKNCKKQTQYKWKKKTWTYIDTVPTVEKNKRSIWLFKTYHIYLIYN